MAKKKVRAASHSKSLPFLVPASEYQFGQANGQPIEIIRTGSFVHPRLGRFDVTEDMIDQMVANFPGPDIIPMDYNHGSLNEDPDESKAAGWVQSLFKEAKTEPARMSLMATVEWTDRALELIESNEFRFISAEMVFNDVDTETGEDIGANLLAAALTNRPFIPKMDPVVLMQPGFDPDDKVALTVARLAQEKSLMQTVQRVIQAFFRQFPDGFDFFLMVEDVFESHLIARMESDSGTQLFRVDFKANDEGLEFTAKEEWVPVEVVFQPVEIAAKQDTPSLPSPDGSKNSTRSVASGAENGSVAPQSFNQERKKMLDKLLEALGFSADADEKEVMEAIATLTAQAGQVEGLEAQIAELTSSKEEVQAQLSQKGEDVVSLTQRAETYEAENAKLSQRVEALETEKRDNRGKALISQAIAEGKAIPAEFNGQDGELTPLGKMAYSQPEVFSSIVANRQPVSASLQDEKGKDADQPAEKFTVDSFWEAVNAKFAEGSAKNSAYDRSQARKDVLAEQPEFEAVLKQDQ